MKITTWNVNSIRSRLARVLAWLQKAQPDILCLQELKATDEVFPYEAIQQAGYHAAVFGQKTYNGVAILGRNEPVNVQRGMSDTVEDPQARFLAPKSASSTLSRRTYPTARSSARRRMPTSSKVPTVAGLPGDHFTADVPPGRLRRLQRRP